MLEPGVKRGGGVAYELIKFFERSMIEIQLAKFLNPET